MKTSINNILEKIELVYDTRLHQVKGKQILYDAVTKDNKKVILLSPYSQS